MKKDHLVASWAVGLMMFVGFLSITTSAEKTVFLGFAGGPATGVYGKAAAAIAVVLKDKSGGKIAPVPGHLRGRRKRHLGEHRQSRHGYCGRRRPS